AADQEGSWTWNPIIHQSEHVAPILPFADLYAEPAALGYPFHGSPSSWKDTSIILTNMGNATAYYTPAIQYSGGGGWLSFGGSHGPVPSGHVPTGCENWEVIGLRATGPVQEGYYQANVSFTYESGTKV